MFKCTDAKEKAFDDIKSSVAQDALLAFPYFNWKIDIHTDTSNYQILAVISQYGKPIGFHSRKLAGLKIRYTVTEKELLSMVKTL